MRMYSLSVRPQSATDLPSVVTDYIPFSDAFASLVKLRVSSHQT